MVDMISVEIGTKFINQYPNPNTVSKFGDNLRWISKLRSYIHNLKVIFLIWKWFSSLKIRVILKIMKLSAFLFWSR